MRDIRFLLKPRYSNSRALIIGIDKYKNVSPLSYAVSDAVDVKQTLIESLGFPEENIICLLDDQATKENILRSFLSFCSPKVELDDRIFVFFAGHGHTVSGFRGEVGYLIPYDARADDLSTLIRWQELTSNSELIRAKHMLFIMDACYGGLALTRALHPGSVRFLKDMTQRYARQVLTAGKADEVVADAGGPLPNHSVFTGHLLNAMRGDAANAEGIITASSLMAYVYTKVANDRNSNQTPHYGYFDGDGDFVIAAPRLFNEPDQDKTDVDEAFVVPFVEEDLSRATENRVSKVKTLLSDDSSSIELHDYLIQSVQKFLSLSAEDNFGTQEPFTVDKLIERISTYEDITKDLYTTEACIAYWAKPTHQQLLQKVLARSTDRLDSRAGIAAWVDLKWYPLVLQLYAAGAAAYSGKRYDSLASIFLAKVPSTQYRNRASTFVTTTAQAIMELYRSAVFKQLPGREHNYVPLSEHLFKLLQPALDDVLFLGKEYEEVFDEFEVLFSLVASDMKRQTDNHMWGPIGRFGYKGRDDGNGPAARVLSEARAQGASWPALQAGLFGGQFERFDAAAKHMEHTLSNLHWY
jgi:uncharacterized caspase-like protein